MNKPLISVVIVAFKSEKHIKKCIDSLRRVFLQTYISHEIIVVVNDTNLSKYDNILKNCLLIRNHSNEGFARAANRGASISSGKWILFINPDSEFLTLEITFLKDHLYKDSSGVLAPKIVNQNGSLQFNILAFPSLRSIFIEQSYLYKIFTFLIQSPQADHTQYDTCHTVTAVSGCCMFVRKSAFQKIKGFDEQFFLYFEDIDICKRITDEGYTVVIEPKITVAHFLHHSTQGSLNRNLYSKSLYLYLRKYHTHIYAQLGVLLLSGGYQIRQLLKRLETIKRGLFNTA